MVLDVGDTGNLAPSPPSNSLWGSLEAPYPGLGAGVASLGRAEHLGTVPITIG